MFLPAVLSVKPGTDGDGCVGVDGAFVVLNVLDFSFLVDDEGRAPRPLVVVAAHWIFPENPVCGEDLAIHVAEERKRDTDLLGKGGVGRGAVHADTENNRVARFDFGQIRLIGLKFVGSAGRESQNVEGEDDILLAPEIA